MELRFSSHLARRALYTGELEPKPKEVCSPQGKSQPQSKQLSVPHLGKRQSQHRWAAMGRAAPGKPPSHSPLSLAREVLGLAELGAPVRYPMVLKDCTVWRIKLGALLYASHILQASGCCLCLRGTCSTVPQEGPGIHAGALASVPTTG